MRNMCQIGMGLWEYLLNIQNENKRRIDYLSLKSSYIEIELY